MAEKSIIIIGAGLAGLSTGCYSQMNGYHTRIYEMHSKPGGLCTAWQRKGYTIGTPGWVMGSGPANNDYYRFWEELGALQGRSMIDYDEYSRIEGKDGQVFIVYTDIDRLEQHMHELAPEDRDLITNFAKALRVFTRIKMPMNKAPELSGPLDRLKMMIKMLPHLGITRKWMSMSLRDFAARFKNPFLSEAALNLFFDPDVSIMYVLGTLATMHLKAADYLVGGPGEFIRAIERRYLDLGGEIHYGLPVAKILVENDQAVGVSLVDGSEHRADVVISAADGRTTLFDMLEGKYIPEKVRSYYNTLPLSPPIMFIALGVARSFDEITPSAGGKVFLFDEPVTIAEREWKWMVVHIYSYDPSLAPVGKTLVRVMVPADYEYWRNLRQDRERYREEKEQVANQVIALLNRRYPGLADQVEMIDVATPVTFERYTGNWQGSWTGWLFTAKTMKMRMSKTLPGLDGFFMVGTWVLGSGLPGSVASGRHITQIICHKDKRPFVTTVP